MSKYTPEQRREWGLRGAAAAARAAKARRGKAALSAHETKENARD
jgi:hypothetical protein